MSLHRLRGFASHTGFSTLRAFWAGRAFPDTRPSSDTLVAFQAPPRRLQPDGSFRPVIGIRFHEYQLGLIDLVSQNRASFPTKGNLR